MGRVDLRRAVRQFGGYSALARRLGVPLSTCHGWHRRRKLPGWREEQIARIAEDEGLDVWRRKRRNRQAARKKVV